MLILHGFLLSALSGALGGTIPGMLQGPFQSLSDVWYAEIGYKTELLRRKAEEKNKLQINAYANDIVSEVTSIPESSVKEPDYSIAGPALEASTYYVNNEIVRKMFAKLVASSVDVRKDGITRSVFVEFVKQMNAVDAGLLKKLAPMNSAPIANLQMSYPGDGNAPFKSEIVTMDFESNLEIRKSLSSAIINLDRMGLIKVDYLSWKSSFNYDEIFKQTPEYVELNANIEQEHAQCSQMLHDIKTDHADVNPNVIPTLEKIITEKAAIGKGQIFLTNLGKDFISVCL